MKDTRRKSRSLRLLNGNPGKRKLKPKPEYSKLDETPPDSLDEVGRAEWMRIVPELRASGVLTVADEKIFWAYCDEFSTAEQCAVKIKEQGLLIKRTSRSKILTPNPYLAIKTKSFAILKGLAVELGLTPSSRSRVSAVATKQDDPYTALKKRREARLADAKRQAKSKSKTPIES